MPSQLRSGPNVESPTADTNRSECQIGPKHFAGIFLLSLATLLLELSLTRVLSVGNWYHFGFLVISTALLGFATSGVVLSLCTSLRDRASLDNALAALSIAFGVSTIASFWLMQRIPFEPFSLFLDRRQLFLTPLYYLVLAAPFFCSGLAIALMFTRGSREVSRLYAADLLGAGLGCAAIALVMPVFGGSGSVLVAATLGLLASVVFGFSSARRLAILGAGLSLVALGLASVAEQAIPITVIPNKRHPLQPIGRTPLYTDWNAFSRVDVYPLSAMPQEGRPDPGYSIIIDAGAAGTAMGDLSMGVRNYLAHSPEYQPPGVAYVGKKHPKVLIIGSGAGREVLEALYFGASSITAVEINPIINEIVTRRMRRQWGGLFEQPEVRLVTEDGRSYVRRSKEKYDAIISVQTMSDAALSSGALSLSETYVLTREAFDDYLDHLKPNGTILVTRPVYQIPKLFATVHEVFDQRHLGSPANHLFAFRGRLAPFGHSEFLTGLLLKKSPLTLEEVQAMAVRVGADHAYPPTDLNPPQILYSPFDSPRSRYQTLLFNLATSPNLRGIYASSKQMLFPATDDSPFFNQKLRWSSLRPYLLREVLKSGKEFDVDAQPVAEVTLVILLLQAIAIAGVLILLPLLHFSRQGLQTTRCWSFLTYFAALGLGFIMIEIVLLQRFTLFLGQPIYTYAVVLASLLIFTGLGSYIVSRFSKHSCQVLFWTMPALLVAIVITLMVTPWLLAATLSLALHWRVIISVALVAPLGLLLGMPFPTGLRIIGRQGAALVPWAWAVNGFFTVIGSVGAMILGMALGFRAVLIIAGVCYFVAVVAIAIGTRPVALAHQGTESTDWVTAPR